MAAPVVNTFTPSRGLAIGGTYVVIDGSGFNLVAAGTVEVFVDGVAASDVRVESATRVTFLTPPARTLAAITAPVDVVVQNRTPQPDPNPDLVEPTTAAAAWTYTRQNISTPNDYSNHSEVALITRELLEQMQRGIIEEVHWDTHGEYADALSALVPEEKLSQVPQIILRGPTIQEDTDDPHRGAQEVGEPGQEFIGHEPVTVRLEFQFVAAGRSSAEAANLWTAVAKFFKRTIYLRVKRNGVDENDGVVEYQMDMLRDQLGTWNSGATRSNIHQSAGSFVIRGVQVTIDSRGDVPPPVDPEVTIDIEPL